MTRGTGHNRGNHKPGHRRWTGTSNGKAATPSQLARLWELVGIVWTMDDLCSWWSGLDDPDYYLVTSGLEPFAMSSLSRSICRLDLPSDRFGVLVGPPLASRRTDRISAGRVRKAPVTG